MLFIAAASGPFAAVATEILAAFGIGLDTLPISSSALAALLRTLIEGSLATRRASSGAASQDKPFTRLRAQQASLRTLSSRSPRRRMASGIQRAASRSPVTFPARAIAAYRVSASGERVYVSARSTVPGGSFLTPARAPRT